MSTHEFDLVLRNARVATASECPARPCFRHQSTGRIDDLGQRRIGLLENGCVVEFVPS